MSLASLGTYTCVYTRVPAHQFLFLGHPSRTSTWQPGSSVEQRTLVTRLWLCHPQWSSLVTQSPSLIEEQTDVQGWNSLSAPSFGVFIQELAVCLRWFQTCHAPNEASEYGRLMSPYLDWEAGCLPGLWSSHKCSVHSQPQHWAGALWSAGNKPAW